MNSNVEFTVAITTYDRPEYLAECVRSILSQTHQSFRIIIGNNHTEKPLSLSDIGTDDKRIEIINNKSDLGQIGNMHILLDSCETEYFTWIADDDLFDPLFLEACQDAIDRFDGPDYIFPIMGKMEGDNIPEKLKSYGLKQLGAEEYLTNFLKRTWFTTGCIGAFRSKKLKEIGWMQQVGSGRSPGSDALLGVKVALLDNIVVLESPLYIFRYHDESFSTNNKDIESCTTAQEDILSKSLPVLKSEVNLKNKSENLYFLLHWQLLDFYTVYTRLETLVLRDYLKHANHSLKYLKELSFFDRGKFFKFYFVLFFKVVAKKALAQLKLKNIADQTSV